MSVALLIWTGLCLGFALLMGSSPPSTSSDSPLLDALGFWIIIWTLGVSIVSLAAWWLGT